PGWMPGLAVAQRPLLGHGWPAWRAGGAWSGRGLASRRPASAERGQDAQSLGERGRPVGRQRSQATAPGPPAARKVQGIGGHVGIWQGATPDRRVQGSDLVPAAVSGSLPLIANFLEVRIRWGWQRGPVRAGR